MAEHVVITGGSQGLGLGMVRALAANGFLTTAVARTRSEALEAAMAVDPGIAFVQADLSRVEALPELARRLRERAPVYGLVNNAGIGPAGILSMMADAQIAEIMALNATSPIILTKHLVKSMMARRAGGRIVNIASIVAANGYPGLAAYSASKAALVGFTRSLAREVGSLGITVNAVSPGFVETRMTHSLTEKQIEQIRRRSALQRLAIVEDVANAVAFLCSEKARSITGTTVTVDSGNTA